MSGGGESVFKIILRAIDQASGPMARVSALATAVNSRLQSTRAAGAALAQATGLDVLGRLTARAAHGLGEMGEKATHAGRHIAHALIGGAVAGGLLGHTLEKISHWGDGVTKTAERLGMTTDQLQAFHFAAEQSGVEAEGFNSAMSRLARNVSEARQGQGDAKDILAALGINLMDGGRLKGLAQLVPEIADAINKVPSRIHRTNIIRTLFGRGADEMANLLATGSKGLAEMGQDLKKRGGLVDKSTLKDAEHFDDTMKALGTSVRGVGAAILGPFFHPLVAMLNKVSYWLGANREILKSDVAHWAHRAGEALEGLSEGAGWLWGWVRRLIPDISGLADALGGWQWIGRVLAVVLGVYLVGALTRAALAAKALGLAMLKNPVTWVIAGLVGLVWVIQNWATVSAWAQGIWREWGPLIVAAGMAITGALIPALVRLAGTLAWALGSGAVASLPLLLNPVTWIIAGIVVGVALLAAGAVYLYRNWATVSAWFKGFWDDWGNAILLAGGFLLGMIGGPVAWFAAAAALIINNWDKLGEFFTALWNDIKEMFTSAINYITSLLPDWLKEKLGLKTEITVSGPAGGQVAPMSEEEAAVHAWRNNLPPPAPARPAAAEALPAWRGGGREEFSGRLVIDVNGPPGTRVREQDYRGAEGLDVDTSLTMLSAMGY